MNRNNLKNNTHTHTHTHMYIVIRLLSPVSFFLYIMDYFLIHILIPPPLSFLTHFTSFAPFLRYVCDPVCSRTQYDRRLKYPRRIDLWCTVCTSVYLAHPQKTTSSGHWFPCGGRSDVSGQTGSKGGDRTRECEATSVDVHQHQLRSYSRGSTQGTTTGTLKRITGVRVELSYKSHTE